MMIVNFKKYLIDQLIYSKVTYVFYLKLFFIFSTQIEIHIHVFQLTYFV
jgi:hypothetical protein